MAFISLAALACSVRGIDALAVNPVIADEFSLRNGAELYSLYCAECHGRASNPTSSYAESSDFSALVDAALGDSPEPETVQSFDEEWPSWARPLEPDSEPVQADERSEVVNDLTGVIDRAYGGIDSRADGLSGPSGPVDDGRLPEATDLTRPEEFFYGTSDAALFNSIANGTGGMMMGWRSHLGSDSAVWDVVNFIRSRWSSEWRE